MKVPKLRNRLVKAAGIGTAAMSAVVGLSIGASPAGALTVPSGAPRWFIGHVEMDRSQGSDTTYYLMQQVGDLYTQAGLYGCTLNSDNATCNTGGDIATTDKIDNYDRVEEITGTGSIGSGAGQKLLCGTSPGATSGSGSNGNAVEPMNIDYARSSKPIVSVASGGCADEVQLGFAKDGVPAVDFPTVNPSAFGTSTQFSTVNGGKIGPVAAGWLPGDPVNGPYKGTPFSNLTNNDSGGGTGSVAYRIWCATDSTRITDWGQLTNLKGGAAVGSGMPIGIPINVMGVNPASGTEATFTTFAQGTATSSCNPNVNAINGDIALENNAAQIGQFAASTYPTNPADQAEFIAATLYFESNGVYNTTPYATQAGVISNGSTTEFTAFKMQEDGVASTAATNLDNSFPTARTLYNIYRTGTVRASTAGFLNWICDSNSSFTKAIDNHTGANYDTELTTLISTTFGFPRLTDQTPAPNNSCQLITSVADAKS